MTNATETTPQFPVPGRPADYAATDIITAGKRLQTAGRSVTAFALRREVGGGNANRLKQIWDEFQASQVTSRQDTAAELPIEVAEAVTAVSNALVEQIAALASELNTKAVRSAERRTAEVVRAAGEQREQAERELIDAAETVDDIEAKLNAEIVEAATLRTTLAEIRDDSQKKAIEIAQLTERNATAERELSKATGELDQVRKKLAAAEAAQKEASARSETLSTALQTAEARASERETRANNLNAELERLHASLTTEKEARSAEQARANEIADELNTVRKQAAHQAEQFAELRANNQGLQQTIDRQRAEQQAAEAERDTAKQQTANQAGELTALRQIVAALHLTTPTAKSTPANPTAAK